MEDKTLSVGDAHSVAIDRASPHTYLVADDIVVATATGPAQNVEIICLRFSNKFVRQNYLVQDVPEGPFAHVKPSGVEGEFFIEDIGVLRLAPVTAEGAAIALIKHLLEHELRTREQIAERLTDLGFTVNA